MDKVDVILGLFFLFILYLTWFLSIIRTFLYVDDKFSASKSRSVSIFLAWLLSLIASMIGQYSIPLGIMELFLQCKLYIERKHMTQEQIKNEDNISIWAEARKHDRIKLIYAYVISLIISSSLIMGNIFGSIIIELYSRYGHKAIQNILSSHLCWQITFDAFKLALLVYLSIIILPTLIRFMLLRRRLNYGLEISFYLWLSLLVSILSQYILLGYMPVTLGLFEPLMVLTVYCILSYKSSEYSEDWCSYSINPMLFMLIAITLMAFISRQIMDYTQWYMPTWEAIFVCYMLIKHKNKTVPTQPEQPPEPQRSEPRQEPEPLLPPLYDTADTLIDIGLAYIGRTTALDNPYITPELTQARHNAERPFLKLLAERYTDTQTRKALSRHFMLYKEVTLFVIFAIVLKNDKQLHSKIQSRLKVRLSLRLPSKVIVSRNEYWHRLSDKFKESYTRTKDLASTLDYVFWSVLPEKLKGENIADLAGNGYLIQIFEHTREAIVQEYKSIREE